MNSELIKALTWAIVELDCRRPNLGEVKTVLELALAEAAGLHISHDLKAKSLVKLAQIWGD